MKSHSLQNGLLVCFLLVSSPAVAGHGFVTTFGDIEWLPEPGRTPDTVGYQLDSWSEAGQLWLATTAQQVVDLSLGFAREKLAEVEAMLTVQDTDAAQVALEHYWYYIDRAEQALPQAADGQDEDAIALVEALTTHLLEHQYILTIIHTDLSVESRSILREVFTTAQQRYPRIADRLPRKKRGALFFKEEEVRWSVAREKWHLRHGFWRWCSQPNDVVGSYRIPTIAMWARRAHIILAVDVCEAPDYLSGLWPVSGAICDLTASARPASVMTWGQGTDIRLNYDVCEARSGDGRGQPGHADYCRDYGPCSAGQGDCDPGQCASGLVCANDVGARYGLPAHYGEARSGSTASTLSLNVTVIGQGTRGLWREPQCPTNNFWPRGLV